MKKDIAGYILAGGKNSRMGGTKKLFLTYKDRSFYDWLCEGLEMLNRVYVSVEESAPYKELVKESLIVDLYEGIGPIGGILSGLLLCEEEALLVIPCDMIPFPTEIVQHLFHVYNQSPQPLVIKEGERMEPFPGIYTKEMIPTLQQMVEKKQFRITDLWRGMEKPYTVLSLEDFFITNINTKAEYQVLREGV